MLSKRLLGVLLIGLVVPLGLAGGVLLSIGPPARLASVLRPAAAAAPSFFEIKVFRVSPAEDFALFHLSTLPVADLEANPENGVKGNGKWVFGDRNAYHSAHFFFQHEDPGGHPFVNGFRIQVQVYSNLPDGAVRINDRNGVEINLGSPYPYEKATIPVDYSRPGAVFDFYHVRNGESAGGCRNCSLLARFVLPPVSPTNPKVKWYYQLGGLAVAVHDTYGPIARVIVSGVLGPTLPQPAYFFREESTP